jgi:hypothetical protein
MAIGRLQNNLNHFSVRVPRMYEKRITVKQPYAVKGKWQYTFLFSHLKELLKLYINFLYRFFIPCLVLEIFSLEVMRCPPSWIHFLSH